MLVVQGHNPNRECVGMIVRVASVRVAPERIDARPKNLSDLDSTEATMAGAILTDVNVPGADRATDLQLAGLPGMDLTACHLAEVDLREAELSGANLEDMDLTGVGLADRSHSRPVERGMSRGHTPRTRGPCYD